MRKRRIKLKTLLLRTALLSVVAGVVAAAAIFLGAYVAFPLRGVAVDGNRMLTDSDVQNMVSSRASLLTINTNALEKEISSNPWVEGVSVRRNWQKDEVTVNVKERVAVLRARVDGKTSVLASDGMELPSAGGRDLPVVELEGWQVPEVLSVARALQGGDKRLQAVDSVGTEGIRTTVGGKSVLVSDSVEPEQAEALAEVFRENPDATRFDLRSPGRVVVDGPDPSAGPQTPAG